MTSYIILLWVGTAIFGWVFLDYYRKQRRVNRYRSSTGSRPIHSGSIQQSIPPNIQPTAHSVSQPPSPTGEVVDFQLDEHDFETEDLDTEGIHLELLDETSFMEQSLHLEPNLPMISPAFEPFIVVLHVKAKGDGFFSGNDLLQMLLSVGLRFGEMSIFHRFEKATGHGEKLFSAASMIRPGTFDINHMHIFKTPGLTLFFECQGQSNAGIIYELMLDTAYKLAKYLDADVLSEQYEPLTTDHIFQLRSRLTQATAVFSKQNEFELR
jgi:cell division protein ZipA